MKFTIIILNILLFSVTISSCQKNNNSRDSLDVKVKNTLNSKQTIDTLKSNNNNFSLLIKGTKNYDILLTSVQKEEYEKALQIKTAQIIDKTTIPSQINVTEECYTVTTGTRTIKNCLKDDEQLISVSYRGFIKNLNSCVVSENWFESSISNLIINLEDGSTSYVSGDELIFSPNLKFLYSYANDGIDFDGISLHQIIDKKALPILITDYSLEEKYKFEFSSFNKAYWVSDTSFYATKDNQYYRFKIQDKQN
ncbi:hypothetical protein [Olleya aquimaris]|uniref:Lipoprotein n=1 Tax=Olleya aquimaris TaxID=639310 RepID=A0A327R5L8_9FLAO|nr:hypothetical protein [Olleya aquimaris]RAJ11901.1 hypothetical protein LY08_02610 [Olleya aquimaris]